MVEKGRRTSRSERVARLLELQKEQCPICGGILNGEDCELDHIVPVCLGGSDELENLQLVHRKCHLYQAAVPFLGHEFKAYVKRLLEAHPSYSETTLQIAFGPDIPPPDLICYRHTHTGTELVIAQIQAARSFTGNGLRQCMQQLSCYHELAPHAKLAFVTPGILPQTYIDAICGHEIELWDRSYLSKEFANQIRSAKPAAFQRYFQPRFKEDLFDVLIRRLRLCPTGMVEWSNYQSLVGEILETLFCPPLKPPIPQKSDSSRKNRRDYILPNYSQEKDVWKFLRERYDADYIVVDAKNSGNCITKQDVLQVGNYLKKGGAGSFAVIVARKGTNTASDHAIREMWLYEHKIIVILNDDDIEQMLLAKKTGADPAELILKKIEDFRLSI